MQDILKLQQRLVPEFLELLQKRYGILRTIYYNQPIGRRVLANSLNIGERIVRSEISFLKKQNLININSDGMAVTQQGEEVLDRLTEMIHEMKGLSEVEKELKERLNIKNVLIVPGNLDEDKTVLNELGRSAGKYISQLIKNNSIIAVTGGSTIKEVIDSLSVSSELKEVLVVPARGGIGRNVELQANTLTAALANKIGGNYKLLHIPDNLSDNALSTILNEEDIKEVINNIKNADLLVYGIGRADEMASRRGALITDFLGNNKNAPVGEAFGYYYDKHGNVVYSSSILGIDNEDIKKIKNLIAVAGGKGKANAIAASQINNYNSTLITDEGAAREIINLLT